MNHGANYTQHVMRIKKRSRSLLTLFIKEKTWEKILNKVIVLFAFLAPLSAVPQIYNIYTSKNAMSLSLLSWFMHIGFTIPWVFYSLLHKEPPLFICNVLWLTMHTITAIGIIIYS